MTKLDIDNCGKIVLFNDNQGTKISFLLEDFFDNSLGKLLRDIELCLDTRKKDILVQFARKYETGTFDFISDHWQNSESDDVKSTASSFKFSFDREGLRKFTANNVTAIHSGFWYAADNLDLETENLQKYRLIYEGLDIAVDKMEEIIAIIRTAVNHETACIEIQKIGLTPFQAESILDIDLTYFTALDKQRISRVITYCDRLMDVLQQIAVSFSESSDSIIRRLKQSPMFQLSLSSKELFHSNFLYWIYQISPKMFQNLIGQLFWNAGKLSELGEWPKEFTVKRERKNFDLCVINTSGKTESIWLVIENKVKSIPNKSQLERYLKQTPGAKHLLLSLVGDSFPEYGAVKGLWSVVSYRNIADILSDLVRGKIGYEYDIIRDYANYISDLDNLANQWKMYGQNISASYVFKKDGYKDLRIDDIYQKVLFSQILNLITERFKNPDVDFKRNNVFDSNNQSLSKVNTLYVNSGLTNDTGFLEVKVKIEDDIALLVQVQGNQYRRCLEFCKDDKTKKWMNLADNISWLKYTAPSSIKQFFALERDEIPGKPYPLSIGKGSPYIPYKRKDGNREWRDGFCKYGDCFIYQYLKIENRSIDDIITSVLEDINNFRSIIGTDATD